MVRESPRKCFALRAASAGSRCPRSKSTLVPVGFGGIFDLDWWPLALCSFFAACLRVAEFAGAVAAFLFYIEFLGKRRNLGGVSSQLPGSPQDNLGMVVIHSDIALDFDSPAFELPHISDVLQITAEDDYLKGAGAVILAEVEEGRTARRPRHFQYVASDTFGSANVFQGSLERDAIGGQQRA